MANKPRRICMIVCACYPLGETRVQREAEALLKQGYEVDVICIRMPGQAAVDRYNGVQIIRQGGSFLIPITRRNGIFQKFFTYLYFFISAAICVTLLHCQRQYAAIQVHNLPDFMVFCVLVPKLFGVPIILDLHDLMPEFYEGRFEQPRSIIARLIRLQECWSCKFADHVITVSEHWRQALVRRGVPVNKCSVIMNVADEQVFRSLRGDHGSQYVNDQFRLIYHGSMHYRYGLDLAVQALDQVRHEIPRIQLFLVGSGEYLSSLHELVNKLCLQENVIFEPLHLAEELPELIGCCDLGIVPYRCDTFTDGLLPTKLMEYAAMGIPAIAARTTAIQAYFSNTNVEFFEPENVDDLARCILRLYHNPERLAALAQGSQKFNQRYNWTRISQDYLSLVDRLSP